MKGLANLGNTCYLNSILQILFNTRGFSKPVGVIETTDSPMHKMVRCLYRLMDDYCADDSASLTDSLRAFLTQFQICHSQFGYGQHDQHEYLTFLLRTIHDTVNIPSHMSIEYTRRGRLSAADLLELESIKALRMQGMSLSTGNLDPQGSLCYNSVVVEMFTGQYRSQTHCQNPDCKYISDRFECFRCCELAIGNHDKPSVTINNILSEFVSVTQLDDGYECDRCKQRTRSKRCCTFWRLPEILIFNLKRIMYDGHRLSRDDREVNAELEIDMKTYLSAPLAGRGSTIYELYATGNHFGTDRGGHCYAQIKTPNGWCTANDDRLINGLIPDARHSYLLFYRRKTH